MQIPFLDHLGRSARVIVRFAGPRQRLHLAIPLSGPVAVLEPGFQLERNMREFPAPAVEAIAQFAPEGVAGRLDAVLALAGRIQPSVLVILTPQLLRADQRDAVWKAFRAPLFEQLTDHDGAVIARECEVHDGLHLEDGATPPPGSELIEAHCECGLETPRLKEMVGVN